MIQNFDERCLDGLKIDEIQSILKSNVMSWGARKKIRRILETKIAYGIISESLPIIMGVVVFATIVGLLKEILERIKEK